MLACDVSTASEQWQPTGRQGAHNPTIMVSFRTIATQKCQCMTPITMV